MPARQSTRRPDPRHALLLLSAVLAVASTGVASADTVKVKNKSIAGTVVYASPAGGVLLGDDDQTHEVGPADLKTAKLTFPPAGRWARLVTKGTPARVTRIVGWDGRAFTARDDKGATEKLPLDAIERITFFPVLAPDRMLSFVPVPQKPDFCGEAVVEMVTSYLGRPVTQDAVNRVAGLDGSRGVYGDELERVLGTLGVRTVGPIRHKIIQTSNALAPNALAADLPRLLRLLDEGRPTLLGIWNDPANKTNADQWACDHFVLLAGYDLARGVIFVRDPNRTEVREIGFDEFADHRRSKFDNVFDIGFRLHRSWRLANGTTVDAECLQNDGKSVRLRTAAPAKEYTIPIAGFTPRDQAFLKAMRPFVARTLAVEKS